MGEYYTAILSNDLFGCRPGELRLVGIADGSISGVEPVAESDLEAVLAEQAGPVLDARELLVLPGLIDCHVHAIASGQLMLAADGTLQPLS